MKSWNWLLLCAVLVTSLMAAGPVADAAQNENDAKKQEKPKKKEKLAFLDAKKAGADFVVQGEYEGTIGEDTNVGAQVIALGDGKFEAALFAGGLPGDGWDEKTVVRLTGVTEEKVTHFTGKNFVGKIEEGELTGTAEGDVEFSLGKVERKPETLGEKPPEGAVILFDGSNADAWVDGKMSEKELLDVGTRTRLKFRDFVLHLEFRTPFMPTYTGQARGNSGVYLLDQYECQVLDSFGLSGEDNECGGIYQIAKPKVNMCLPPLSWQSYHIEFTAARFDKAGNKISDAVVTVEHNGVIIHEDLKVPHITKGGGQTDEMPGPLYFQNHGDPVRFRNIWIVEE